MNNIHTDARLKYSTYGNGKAIIEILNIGFEPLLTDREYKIYKEIGDLKKRIYGLERTISFIESKMMYLNSDECYYIWLGKYLYKFKKRNLFTRIKQSIKINFLKICLMQTYISHAKSMTKENLKMKNNSEILPYLKVI